MLFPWNDSELAEAWTEGTGARWRSATTISPQTGSRESGAFVLELAPGDRLERHTDSAEEVIVVISGEAEVTVGEASGRLGAGGLALVPQDAPHEIRNAGDAPLRFAGIYASATVTTRYDRAVQPGGSDVAEPLG